jgi:hypothetical protein
MSAALNGHAGSHQICPLLKVDRTCHRAAVTSHVDPQQNSNLQCNRLLASG